MPADSRAAVDFDFFFFFKIGSCYVVVLAGLGFFVDKAGLEFIERSPSLCLSSVEIRAVRLHAWSGFLSVF